MPLLDSGDVDGYIARFKADRTIVLAGRSGWDDAILERNRTPAYDCAVSPDRGPSWTTASHADLRAVAPLLVRLLASQVTEEHFWFVDALTAKCSPPSRVPGDLTTVVAVLHAALRSRPPTSPLAHGKYLLAAPLLFAALEASLKLRASSFVARGGAVLQPWEVTFEGKPARYVPKGTSGGNYRVSRVGHLLALARSEVLSPSGRLAVESIERELAQLEGRPLTSGLLDSALDGWRNEFVHGARLWTARVPVVMSVFGSILLEW